MQLLEVETLGFSTSLEIPPLASLSLPLILQAIQPPQGNLNFIRLYVDSEGKGCLLRLENPEGRAKELPFITAEFEHVGFLNNPGNGFRLRSPHEQAVFSEKLHAAGLSVPLMHYSTSEFLLMDFYPNTTTQADLWRLAPQRALNSTKDILQGLALAHKEDLILGDRWGKNELISPNQEVSFVDFDIELFGPQAKEFELAMFLFFNAYFAQLNSGELLGDLLELSSDFLSILPTSSEKQVRTFVRNFSDYFKKGTIYAWRNNKDVDQLKDILC